jgi:hypothetical protein
MTYQKPKRLKGSHRSKKVGNPAVRMSRSPSPKVVEEASLHAEDNAEAGEGVDLDESQAAPNGNSSSTNKSRAKGPKKPSGTGVVHLHPLMHPYVGRTSTKLGGKCAYRDPLKEYDICEVQLGRASDLPRHFTEKHGPKEGEKYEQGEFDLKDLPMFLIALVVDSLDPRRTEEEKALAAELEKRLSASEPPDLAGLDLDSQARAFMQRWRDLSTCQRCGSQFSRADALTRHKKNCKSR